MSNEIQVALDDVIAAVNKLAASHADFPDPGTVAHTAGPAAGASQQFRAELNKSAQSFSATTELIRKELADIQVAITKAASSLVEADTSVGGDLSTLTNLLDTASVPGGGAGSTAAPAPLPKPSGGGSTTIG